MTAFNYIFTGIIPAAFRDAANALAEAMGMGQGVYSIALSPNGADPATHYATQAQATPVFRARVHLAATGTPPDGADDALIAEAMTGMPSDADPDALAALMGALIYSFTELDTTDAQQYRKELDALLPDGVRRVYTDAPMV